MKEGMTTKTDQAAAEKWAIDNQYIIGPEHPQWWAYCKISHRVIERMAGGFLAGCAHKGTPIKIDPNDESTWPPESMPVIALLDYRNQYEWQEFIRPLESDGSCLIGYTYWAPLPTLPEVEG